MNESLRKEDWPARGWRKSGGGWEDHEDTCTPSVRSDPNPSSKIACAAARSVKSTEKAEPVGSSSSKRPSSRRPAEASSQRQRAK
eukprot:scaffold6734_cov23-Tisochrysis_lutea.AAC.3